MSEESVGAPRKFQSRRADYLAVAVLFALITIVFSDVWFRGSCFFVRDLTRYYFPTKRIVHDIVRAGELPLWNRFYSGGQPAAANPEYEVFYPGQWPVLLRDYFFGFRLHILIHFYIAALGMYALMRSLRTGVGAAFITATAFVFSGPLLSLVNLLPAFFSVAWLPFTVLFSRRYIVERRRRDLVLAALFFGVQALVFDPAVLPETVVLISAFAVWTAIGLVRTPPPAERGEPSRLRLWRAGFPLLAVMSIVLFGLAIGAVQVIPTFRHVRDTPRGQALTFDAIAFWSMPPQRLGELLQPRWSGRNPFLSDDYWGGGVYRQGSTPFIESLYIGLLPLIALAAGLIRRDRRIIGAVCAACASWVIAFGENTPLLRLAYDLHVPLPVRFPERFAILAAIILTIAAGLIIDRIIEDDDFRRTVGRVAMFTAAACTAFMLFTFTLEYGQLFATFWHAAGQPITRHWFELSRTDWLVAAARAAVLALVLFALRRRSAGVVAAVLAIFVAADLLPYVGDVAPRQGRAFFERPTAAEEMRRPADQYRIFFEPEWSSGSTSRSYFADAQTRYWTVHNGMFPRVPAAYGFSTIFERDIDLTNIAATDDLTEAMWRVRRSGRPDWAEIFSAMANVGYRAAYRPFQQEVQRHPDPRQIEPIVFVPVGPNPRYYFADEVVGISSYDNFVYRIISERHSRHAAYVALPRFQPAPSSITGLFENANTAVLDVNASGYAFLVRSVTWHRNWHATIDGASVPIVPTNIAFQGVRIPPGRHRVEFFYRDWSVLAGAVVSLLALLASAVAVSADRFSAASVL